MTDTEITTSRRRAKGSLGDNGNRKIAVSFDGSTFRKIADEAQKSDRSFGQQVRLYIRLGMEKAKA